MIGRHFINALKQSNNRSLSNPFFADEELIILI